MLAAIGNSFTSGVELTSCRNHWGMRMTHSTRLARLPAIVCFACSLLASAAISPGLAQDSPKTSVQDPDKRKVKFDFLGDALPPHALLRFGTNRFNPSSINQLSLSPDNKSVVTSAGRTLNGWDALTGKELWSRDLIRNTRISSASYGTQTMVTSSSGSLVACGSAGKIFFIDFHDGKTTRTINSSVKEEFKAIDVSPDGKWFAGGNENQLVVFDESGNTKFSIENEIPKRKVPLLNSDDRMMFGGEYSYARFAPDGKQLVLVHSQNSKALHVVNFETGKIVREIPTKGNVVRFDFSKDGSQVVTTERDIAARLYDLESGKQVWEQVFSQVRPRRTVHDGCSIFPRWKFNRRGNRDRRRSTHSDSESQKWRNHGRTYRAYLETMVRQIYQRLQAAVFVRLGQRGTPLGSCQTGTDSH